VGDIQRLRGGVLHPITRRSMGCRTNDGPAKPKDDDDELRQFEGINLCMTSLRADELGCLHI
jgi:hypothetical protein